MGYANVEAPACHQSVRPFASGHWSLLDMINYQAFGLVHWLDLVQQELTVFGGKHMMLLQLLANGKSDPFEGLTEEEKAFTRAAVQVTADDLKRLDGFLTYASALCAQLELTGTENRIVRFRQMLREPSIAIAPGRVAQEVRTLHEALQDDLNYKGFYYYPDAKRAVLQRLDADWDRTLLAFKTLRPDLEGALDCYAVGHSLACVFYLMRVMEAGVQRLAKRLKAPLTATTKGGRLTDLTWHQILDGLNPKLRALPQDTPARRARHERFSAIQSYLYAVKDAWRNPTMHPRKEGYSDLEALNVINHVRSFMNELASELSSR